MSAQVEADIDICTESRLQSDPETEKHGLQESVYNLVQKRTGQTSRLSHVYFAFERNARHRQDNMCVGLLLLIGGGLWGPVPKRSGDTGLPLERGTLGDVRRGSLPRDHDSYHGGNSFALLNLSFSLSPYQS